MPGRLWAVSCTSVVVLALLDLTQTSFLWRWDRAHQDPYGCPSALRLRLLQYTAYSEIAVYQLVYQLNQAGLRSAIDSNSALSRAAGSLRKQPCPSHASLLPLPLTFNVPVSTQSRIQPSSQAPHSPQVQLIGCSATNKQAVRGQSQSTRLPVDRAVLPRQM